MDFSSLDNYEGIKYIDDNCCDSCNTICKIPFYHSNSFEIDLCYECYNGKFQPKIINNENESAFNYNCKQCNNLCIKWKMICISNKFIVLCDYCSKNKDTNIYDLYDFFKIDKYHVICYSHRQLYIDNSTVIRSIEGIPSFVNITPKLISTYVSLLDRISYVPKDFGSIKQWCIFQNFSEIPFFNIFSSFIYDFVNKRIGIIIIDTSFLVGFFVIYDNPQEFLYEHDVWKDNYEFDEQLYSKIENQMNSITSDVDDNELSKLCTSFSSYLTIKNKIPFAAI